MALRFCQLSGLEIMIACYGDNEPEAISFIILSFFLSLIQAIYFIMRPLYVDHKSRGLYLDFRIVRGIRPNNRPFVYSRL